MYARSACAARRVGGGEKPQPTPTRLIPDNPEGRHEQERLLAGASLPTLENLSENLPGTQGSKHRTSPGRSYQRVAPECPRQIPVYSSRTDGITSDVRSHSSQLALLPYPTRWVSRTLKRPSASARAREIPVPAAKYQVYTSNQHFH